MSDHSSQSASLKKLHHNPLTEGLSGLDISGSMGLDNQHKHASSRFVPPSIIPTESPVFVTRQIKTADLDLKNIFQGDRNLSIQTEKKNSNQPLSFHQDHLTGKVTDAQLVGSSKGQLQSKNVGNLERIGSHLLSQGLANTQPLVGIIDTGFNVKDLQSTDTSVQLGRDRIDGDDDPLVKAGNQHGSGVLNVIIAKDSNAPLWLGRSVGSGKWADSLVEFVDSAKTSGRAHAVVNLSFDLTQVNADGSITTRQQLTSQEREALNYAQQNGVLIVAAAGNTGNEMSALGQASQEFDNIITVGAAKGLDRANYSSYGSGLTLLAPGSIQKNDNENGEGTSIATAEVTGAVSQVWAANSKLGYRQVIDILKATATDLNTPGQDNETGAGLLNQTNAIHLATLTTPVLNPVKVTTAAFTSQTFDYTPLERSALWGVSIPHIPIVSDVVNGVKNVAEKGVDVAQNVGSHAVDVAQNVGNSIVNTAIDTATHVLDPIVSVVNTTSQIASSGIHTVLNVADGAINTVGNMAGAIVSIVGNVAGEAINTAGNVAGTVASTAGNVAGETIHTAGNVAGAIVSIVDPNAGAAVKGVVDLGASVVNGVGNGIGTGIQVGTDITKNVVSEKITGILQGEIYKVQQFPDRLKRLGKDLAKNPTKGFGKWVGRVSVDLAETLGVPEDAEAIASLLKPKTRSLTSDEIKLAKSVFGNSINYRLVKLDEAAVSVDWTKQLKGFNAPRPFTTFHTINSWGKLEKETLIHELTHVWQYEHGGAKYIPEALAVNGKSSGYDYKGVSNLRKFQAAGKKMSSFNPEQQAKIVEEYFLIKTGQESKATFSGGATSKDLPTYAHFVKEVSTLSEKKLD